MSLTADVRLRLGRLDLEAGLAVDTGETVAVLGPNGAGKTTLLRALAGLAPIDDGSIVLDGETLDQPSTNTYVVPERRRVAVVFQDYLLFPHLSALENVAFGLRSRGMKRDAARARAREWLDRVGLGDRSATKPGELSGGQKQRVALARALVTEPQLLLLDEPLAALDAGSRVELRQELRAHLSSFPAVRVLVTHDPVDAAALADRLVILEDGRVVQSGSMAAITARPRSRYVAELVGVNLFHGVAHANDVHLDGGAHVVDADPHQGDVFVLIHPRAVALHPSAPAGSPRNVWRVRPNGVEPLGERVRVRLEGELPLVAEVTPAAAAELALADGAEVWAAVKATDVSVYPA